MAVFRKSCLPLLLIWSLKIHAVSAANDTIDTSRGIIDGETLVSSRGKFELGFFSPGNHTNRRYLGIWFHNISVQTVVWVANRQVPLTTMSGVLRVTESGVLAILNDTNGVVVWSSNASSVAVVNPTAQLLDSGNLVVKSADDGRPQNFVWQSFDHPSDRSVPGMSLGWNLATGVETYLTSWRSSDDPAPGEFTLHLDPAGYPQFFLKRGETALSRVGPWNGILFSGSANISYRNMLYATPAYRSLEMNEYEVKYKEDSMDPMRLSMAMIDSGGCGQHWIWNHQTQAWDQYSFSGEDDCDRYNFCGANGICNIGNSLPCGCLDGFVPEEFSNGCVRSIHFNCRDDMFVKYSGIRLPDSRNSTYDRRGMSLADCEAECSRKCNCTAYTQLDIKEKGSGCLFYYGDLIDIRTMARGGEELHIRMASSKVDSGSKKPALLIASITSVVGTVVICLSLIWICVWKRKKGTIMKREGPFSGSHGEEAELLFFNLSKIIKATDHFSDNNKLGEGGFGPVYKGRLEDGQEIAVKRLSTTSSQGVDELKNEVILIARLQHRNLVRLLGCCIQRDENMLIYEYMPNNSLDLILFDQTKNMLLDWQRRFHIINGIAKGLVYLHQDSRLRIIHRDLKASNILLDADMNPKISDFGLARSFRGNEAAFKTRRVIGTYGYMSPEYAIDGLFSVKSDVFSFGVLVLEIVCGKRNRGFVLKDNNLNLLGHAWTLYKEGNSSKLVDSSLGDSFDLSQALRSIHVGLLCVQKRLEDRPNMSSVVFMLGNDVALPPAKQPGFFTERDVVDAQSSSSSENLVTITMPEGR